FAPPAVPVHVGEDAFQGLLMEPIPGPRLASLERAHPRLLRPLRRLASGRHPASPPSARVHGSVRGLVRRGAPKESAGFQGLLLPHIPSRMRDTPTGNGAADAKANSEPDRVGVMRGSGRGGAGWDRTAVHAAPALLGREVSG